MSAPVTERGRAAARAATIPAQRGETTGRPQGWAALPGEQKAGQRSARRAYARRDDRLRRLVGGRPVRTAAPSGRAQFVLLIMALLVIALVATLWFSTAATADSYRLQDARAEALALRQQAEQMHREVAVLESPPELARRAADMGMVQVQDPPRLVVAPDGGVELVGEPRAAAGQPRPLPAGPVAPAPPGQPPSGQPAEQPPPAGQPETPAAPAGPAQLAAGQDTGQHAATDGPTVVAQGAAGAESPDTTLAEGAPAGAAAAGTGQAAGAGTD